MSRISDNARANSAGDGDSVLSSYENSPRNKTPELNITGPCGDYSVVQPANIIFHATNSSTDSDDQECAELKMEYLQRINQIRDKLATIDIANRSYYDSCFAYPPISVVGSERGQCQITEIFDEETHLDEKNYESVAETKSIVPEIKPSSYKPLSCSSKGSDTEFKTILDYSASFKEMSSSVELLDLNYNPPKKRTCIRENTPKFSTSDGVVSLPYHIRVSLDDVISKSNKSPGGQQQLEKESTAAAKAEVITKAPTERPNHIFPRVQIECSEKECLSTKGSESGIDPNGAGANKPDSPKDHVCLLFFDTLEQSVSVSPKTTNRSRDTDITSTTDSSTQRQQKRRLMLRSASNKVKPTDKMSLWEEIRTMEALKKKSRPESSGSHDSQFRKVILSKTEKEKSLDINAIGSFEVPRKSKKIARFPSITKITSFCSSVFKKPNSTESKAQDSVPKSVQPKTFFTPKTADALLDIKKEQDVDLNLEDTPTGEKFSQCSYSDEDDFDSYNPFCIFCFCF
ncbi:uncharacterized protein LOC126737539 [Anthonomus grandis grandis]|uniref:uncharacterized protein LOC126737539 n=1 Tax=Anthonomus grandis grandis TaxID=2921223 RepID=UPI002166AC43|nr:uncharacterized protein LOC126737539 [Anthonomus grandis grandis]